MAVGWGDGGGMNPTIPLSKGTLHVKDNAHAIINHIVHVSELNDLRIQILKVSKCQHECRSERQLSPHQALINLDRIREDSSQLSVSIFNSKTSVQNINISTSPFP